MAPSNRQSRHSRRELILDAAAELFADEGFASTNSQRIAERAGVAAGLLYYHFETKHDILATLLTERTLTPLLAEALTNAELQDPREILRLIGTTMLRGVEERQDIARILWQETRLNNPDRRYLPDMLERGKQQLTTLIGEAVGWTVPLEVMRMRVEAFQSTLVLALMLGPPNDPDGYIDALVDVTWPA